MGDNLATDAWKRLSEHFYAGDETECIRQLTRELAAARAEAAREIAAYLDAGDHGRQAATEIARALAAARAEAAREIAAYLDACAAAMTKGGASAYDSACAGALRLAAGRIRNPPRTAPGGDDER